MFEIYSIIENIIFLLFLLINIYIYILYLFKEKLMEMNSVQYITIKKRRVWKNCKLIFIIYR